MSMHQDSKVEHASGGLDELPDVASITHNLKPALASILDALRYMGGPSRAKFYADILPQLETVHLGRRHFVVVASMDRLIASLKNKPERPLAQSHEPVGIVGPCGPRNHHRQPPESPSLETCNNSDPAPPIEAGMMPLSRRRNRRREGARDADRRGQILCKDQ